MIKLWKRLLLCVKGYKIHAILAPLFVMIECVFDILIPYTMTFLLAGVEEGDMKAIFIYGTVIVLMALLALSFGILSGRECAVAAAGFAKNVRNEMYAQVQKYSFSNIDKFSPSSIVTRMTTDVNMVQNAFQMMIRVAIRCPFMLVFALIATLVLGGNLAVVYVFVVPLMVLGLFLIFKSAYNVFKVIFKKYDRLNQVVEENVRAIRVVKSNVREDYEIEKFNSVSEDICRNFTKAQKILALNNPLMQLSMYIVIIVIAYFGAVKIIDSNQALLSVSKLSTLITYSTQILMSLMMLSMVFATITISRTSAERICEILEEKADIASPENGLNCVKDGSVSFENVDFSYSNNVKKLALKNINIEIKSGETVGIIGGTGSGKTTLVQLLPRLYDVMNGVVKVGGVNVREYNLEALRNGVAFVLQKNVLFQGTVRSNLAWGNENATDEEMYQALKLARIYDTIMNKGGLDTEVEQGGANFSGGQKQRLCIARALMTHPKILVLDDSTSAVDVTTDKNIKASLRQFMPETTKIIIAQRISSVMDADKIFVLDGGEVESVGTHDELLKTSRIYSEVFNSQVGGDFDESQNA
ncbi:MAG: ABC transporter ATP-binding protein [Christensenellaceae bacterium]